MAFLAVLGQRREIGAHLTGQRRVDIDFVGVVEEREKAVVVLLRDRVELVVVALRAADGQAHPNRADGAGAVDDFFEAELFDLDASLAILKRVAVEARGDFLFGRCVFEQVTGYLFSGELVEGYVVVERVDDPMPVSPGVRTNKILLVAVAVGVACQVEPLHRPLFAVVRRLEKPVGRPFVGVRAVVGDEIVDFLGRRRQAHQIEAQAPD